MDLRCPPLAALALLVACAIARDASAQPRRGRLVLLDASEVLAHAVVVALTPWDLEVVRAPGAPGATLPAAEQRARAVVSELHADVVVWISPGDEQSVLWFYDAQTQHVGSRVVDARLPYDAPTAAAVALTMKTLLQSSTVAPKPERAAAPPPVERDATIGIDATVSERWVAGRTMEPRAGLGVARWTRIFGVRVAAAFAFTAGPGVDLAADAFTGRYTDASLAPSLRARFDLGRIVAIEPQVGATLHLTTLDGVVAPDLAPIHARRADGSLDAGAFVAFRVAAKLDVGFFASVSYMTRYQTYVVSDRTVLDLSPTVGELGLRLALRVM